MYSGTRDFPMRRGHSHRRNKVSYCRSSSEELWEVDQCRIVSRLLKMGNWTKI